MGVNWKEESGVGEMEWEKSGRGKSCTGEVWHVGNLGRDGGSILDNKLASTRNWYAGRSHSSVTRLHQANLCTRFTKRAFLKGYLQTGS